MNKPPMLFCALALTVLYSSVGVTEPTLDSAGKCRDNGRFVAADLCKPAAATSGKCRDVKTKKFAKCGTPNTERVPTDKTKE